MSAGPVAEGGIEDMMGLKIILRMNPNEPMMAERPVRAPSSTPTDDSE